MGRTYAPSTTNNAKVIIWANPDYSGGRPGTPRSVAGSRTVQFIPSVGDLVKYHTLRDAERVVDVEWDFSQRTTTFEVKIVLESAEVIVDENLALTLEE